MAIDGLIDYNIPMKYAMGFDTVRMKPKGFGVKGVVPDQIKNKEGQTVLFNLQKTSTREEYMSALDIHAEAEASWGFWGGSAKFDFAEKQNFNKFSVYLVASILVKNGFLQIDNPQLTDQAKELLTKGDTDRFTQQFGDKFILGMEDGGAYYAIFEFSSETSEGQQDISAEIDLGGLCWDASGSFKNQINSLTSKSHLRISAFQQGGLGEGAQQEVTLEKIIEKAQKFPTEVDQHPVHYKAYLQDYITLDLPQIPNTIDVEHRQSVIRQYYSLRNELQLMLNDISYIRKHPEQFDNPDIGQIAKDERNITNAIQKIKEKASCCANNVNDCDFAEPPEVETARSVKLPSRKATPPASSALTADDRKKMFQQIISTGEVTGKVLHDFTAVYKQE